MTDDSKQVIVTTEWRGVFHGTLDTYQPDKRNAEITDARCVIIWGTQHGWLELAADGPPTGAKLGSVVPRLSLPGVTSVAECSEKAAEAWSCRT